MKKATTCLKTAKRRSAILAAVLAVSMPWTVSWAQESGTVASTIEIDPLFEYPMAPEELSTITEKSDWVVEHFWDNMDFKTKTAVDQNAMNDAIRVYCVPLRWADKPKAIAAIDKFLEKLQKNPTLLLQAVKGAEENLYSPRADVWIDEVYVKYLEALMKNKKISKERKAKYERQLKALANTMEGAKAPEFGFTSKDGRSAQYFPMSTPTMIIFGDPGVTEWRMSRMRMETNLPLRQAVEKGKVNILYILPNEREGWQDLVSNYPSAWTVGYSPDVKGIYDLRLEPSVYVIDAEGGILKKNVTPEEAINTLLGAVK